MLKSIWFAVILPAIIMLSAVPALGQAPNQATVEKPPIKKLAENIYQIGNIIVDGEHKEISFDGWVNMSEGMVELLACAPGGKTHESVLVFDVEPFHFQIALLLMGLECSGGLKYQGDPATPKGDPVDIFVTWTDPVNSKTVSVRGEDLVYDIQKKRAMKRTHWIFAGSRVIDGVFAAQAEKSLVTTYHDPNTILDNPLPTGADDTVYEANRAVVPPVGTKVKVTVKPYEKRRGSREHR